MKISPYLLLPGLLLAGAAMATPATEQESLALLLRQFDQLNATLQRAQRQASLTAGSRFFFDYPQAHADIRAMRTGVEHYLSPSRAQPRTVLPLMGLYRQEQAP
ncbi:RAQPRD family integrative conjugative element protein [Buttiauxella selenatireducens]|uniref:RAQPRD family integrative conjugative element protein n=1 Tax=Buttiauxella selenatireducens TaxID=3073902 RepID=A0ABY9S633_9ENTR|nr:RAQPRD family integrative conjugative element protein [Buttiauxella sp. R73]WMY72485.1 RAQPRD family integrative conjugative element protein [Buttiauxella sp. R73]